MVGIVRVGLGMLVQRGLARTIRRPPLPAVGRSIRRRLFACHPRERRRWSDNLMISVLPGSISMEISSPLLQAVKKRAAWESPRYCRIWPDASGNPMKTCGYSRYDSTSTSRDVAGNFAVSSFASASKSALGSFAPGRPLIGLAPAESSTIFCSTFGHPPSGYPIAPASFPRRFAGNSASSPD